MEVSREKSSPRDIIVNLSLSGKMFASPTFFPRADRAEPRRGEEEGNMLLLARGNIGFHRLNCGNAQKTTCMKLGKNSVLQ